MFIASDYDHMIATFISKFKHDGITFHKQTGDDPLLDLVILSGSSHFIGNCVSSFSGVVKRIRDNDNLPTTFWAFRNKTQKIEL